MFIVLLKLMRPKQWVKNLIIFAGLVFSQRVFHPDTLRPDLPLIGQTTLGFVLFCLLSGAVYVFNDLLDLEADRNHPLKKERPLPSGQLSKSAAVSFGVLLSLGGLLASFLFLGRSFGLLALTYYLLMIGYSTFFKHVVILDVFSIALGFVIRAAAGVAILKVEFSSWLLLCTLLLALFLALSKRRHELTLLEAGASLHRPALAEYSPYFLDQLIAVVTASTLMSYALYTMAEETVEKFHSRALVFTLPFVLYGIFRYLYLVHQKEGGGNPTLTFLTDKYLIIDIGLWLLAIGYILYG